MEIRYSRSAQRALLKSNKRELIAAKIRALSTSEMASNANVVRLQGRDDYRLRIQDWRVIFRVEDNVLWVDAIGPRGSVYER